MFEMGRVESTNFRNRRRFTQSGKQLPDGLIQCDALYIENLKESIYDRALVLPVGYTGFLMNVPGLHITFDDPESGEKGVWSAKTGKIFYIPYDESHPVTSIYKVEWLRSSAAGGLAFRGLMLDNGEYMKVKDFRKFRISLYEGYTGSTGPNYGAGFFDYGTSNQYLYLRGTNSSTSRTLTFYTGAYAKQLGLTKYSDGQFYIVFDPLEKTVSGNRIDADGESHLFSYDFDYAANFDKATSSTIPLSEVETPLGIYCTTALDGSYSLSRSNNKCLKRILLETADQDSEVLDSHDYYPCVCFKNVPVDNQRASFIGLFDDISYRIDLAEREGFPTVGGNDYTKFSYPPII